jgi:hypothetical protein
MKKILFRLLLVIAVLTAVFTNLYISAGVNAGAGALSVTNGPVVLSIAPGAASHYIVTVTNAFAMDLEVDGLGENPDGSIIPLLPQNDTSSYIARTWVSIDKTHLNAGVNQSLNITVAVPAGTAPGERYAAVYMHSQPTGQGNTGIMISSVVPIIITVTGTGYTPAPSGSITNLSVASAIAGSPLEIDTIFKNTGNCRIGPIANLPYNADASATVTVKDASGNQISQVVVAIALPSMPSLIPTFSRNFKAKLNKSGSTTGLDPGNYTAESKVVLSTGAVLDTKTLTFQVVQPPAAPTLISPGNTTNPGPLTDNTTPTLNWNAVTGADYYAVTINGLSGSSYTVFYISDNITGTSFTVPDQVLGPGGTYSWQVKAHNAAGWGSLSSPFYFKISGTTAAPVIGSFSPALGASGATVTINGTNFTGATAVSFGGTAAASFTVDSATQIRAVVGTGSTGIISITTSGGTTTSASTFTFLSNPSITSFSPASGPSGTSVVINGTNFTGATAVSFGGTAAASFTINSSTQITVVLGNGDTGNITVVTSGGTAISSSAFTVLYKPVITAFSPITAGNGASVVILGQYLNGATAVSFGGTAAKSFNVDSDYQITAVVGGGSSGSISVTAPGGTVSFAGFVFSTASTTTMSSTTVTTTSTSSSTTPSRNYKGYFPPTIDEPSLTYQDFTGDSDAKFNAADKTWAEAVLTGTNNHGTIIMLHYLNLPQTAVQFSSGSIKGGIGKSPIKFVGVRVEGTTKGTARVTIHYTDSEVSKYNTDSLILGYFSQGTWHQCTNITVSNQNNTVSGDIPVIRLSGTAIGLGSDLNQTVGGVPFAAQQNSNGSNPPGVSWALVGIVMASLLIVGGVIFAIERNRRKVQDNR